MTLEDLLRMTVKGKNSVTKQDIEYHPDFRVAVQSDSAVAGGNKGVHIIIHANGHNSETMDFIVTGNELFDIGNAGAVARDR